MPKKKKPTPAVTARQRGGKKVSGSQAWEHEKSVATAKDTSKKTV